MMTPSPVQNTGNGVKNLDILSARLTVYKCKKICVNLISVCSGYAVGSSFISIEFPIFDQFSRQLTGIIIRDNLIVIAMNHQYRDGYSFLVFSKVGLRKSNDPIVMRFGAPHH